MSQLRSVYLDNNATTRPRPEVVEAMVPILSESWGNPSSPHHYGRPLKARIAEAREIVASALNADPSEIVFTSGGTESDNLAIKGYAWANRKHGAGHIITSAVEHPGVLEPVKYLSKNGFFTTTLPVDGDGLISIDKLKAEITDNTILLTIQAANNETGALQPLSDVVGVATEKGIAVHTDAVQAFCKTPLDVKELGVDLLSVSGHKIHGPKGIGALYVRKGTKLHSLQHGGHHERGIRSGTENVAGVIGFAKAVELAMDDLEKTATHTSRLRDELEKAIVETIPAVRVNGPVGNRLPNTTNISFECVEGEALLINLDMVGIAISTGSACSSGSLDPSHVLMAMGIPHEIIHGSLRFSFSHENGDDDVAYVMSHLPRVIEAVRRISPLWDSVNRRPITLEEAKKGATTTVKE